MSPKVAIVLSGGGAKGAYEAGALLPIVQRTQDVHIVTGASIGAINAAVFASTYEDTGDILQAADAVKRAWFEIGPLFKFDLQSIGRNMMSGFLGAGGPINVRRFFNFPALVDTTAIKNKINELLPDCRISDITSIELAVNATNLTTGGTVTFTSENDAPLREAVLASSCLPILFPPVAMADGHFVDGGVFNNTPLKDALVLGATDVFIVGLKPKETVTYFETIVDQDPFANIFDTATRLAELILDKIMYEDLKNARRINKVVAVIHELEKHGDSEALRNLKQAIGYEKGDRTKKHVNFHDIAPDDRLDPPGTLGFDQRDALHALIERGEEDAREQLRDVTPIRW